MTAPIEELDKEFDEAFDEFTSGEATSETPKTELEASSDTAPQEGGAEPADAATQDAPEDGDVETKDTTEDIAADDSAEVALQSEGSAPEADELARLQALYDLERERRESAERRYRTSEGRLKAANKQRETPEATKPEEVKVEPSAALKEFQEEFPELIDPINELVNARIKAAVSQVQDLVDTRVAPIETRVHESTQSAHLTQIEQAHPDWKQILDSGDFDKWMVGLNPMTRAGVEKVLELGSTKEVIDMFSVYKSEVGNSTPQAAPKARKSAAAPKAQPTAPAAQQPLDDDLVERLKAALAVPASRGAAPATTTPEVDPDDFDAAFEEATRDT